MNFKLKILVQNFGTQRDFGLFVGVTQQTVSQWINGTTFMSAYHAKIIHELFSSDIELADLRPDIFEKVEIDEKLCDNKI